MTTPPCRWHERPCAELSALCVVDCSPSTDAESPPPCDYGHTKADHEAVGACLRPSMEARVAAHKAYPDPTRTAVRIAFERGWDAHRTTADAMIAEAAAERAQAVVETVGCSCEPDLCGEEIGDCSVCARLDPEMPCPAEVAAGRWPE